MKQNGWTLFIYFGSLFRQGIQLQGVFYPEGSKLNPAMNSSAPIPTISLSKWDQVRQKAFTKAERNSKTRSMVLTNFR